MTSTINLAMLSDELKRLTIVVNGVSKTYAMTGWRIGYLAAPKEVAAAVTRVQSQSTSNPTSIAQKAALAALTGPQDCVETMVKEFERRRNFMINRLEAMPRVGVFKPGGTFYLFGNSSSYFGLAHADKTIRGSLDLSAYLMDKAHLAVVPGMAFGEDSCLRLSYALSMSQIEQGLDRLSEALAKLS